MEIDVKLNKWQ